MMRNIMMKKNYYSIMQSPPFNVLLDVDSAFKEPLKLIYKSKGYNPISLECSKTYELIDDSTDLVIANLDHGADAQELLEKKEKYDYSLILLTMDPEKTNVYNLVRDGADAWIKRPYKASDLVDFSFRILKHREKKRNKPKEDVAVLKGNYNPSIENILVESGYRVHSTVDKETLEMILTRNIKTVILHDYHDPLLHVSIERIYPYINILTNSKEEYETISGFNHYSDNNLIEVLKRIERSREENIKKQEESLPPILLGLIGPSGAGKTTLSFLMQNILPFIDIPPRDKSRNPRQFEYSSQTIHMRKEEMLARKEEYELLFTHRKDELVGIRKSYLKAPHKILTLANPEAVELARERFGNRLETVYLTAKPEILMDRLAKRYTDRMLKQNPTEEILDSIYAQESYFQKRKDLFDHTIDTSCMNPYDICKAIILRAIYHTYRYIMHEPS